MSEQKEFISLYSTDMFVFMIYTQSDPREVGNNYMEQACLRIQYVISFSSNSLHQYSKTSVMHFLFSSLRIRGLCMFRALLAHLQEAIHKRHLVYCWRVMLVGCTRTEVELCGGGGSSSSSCSSSISSMDTQATPYGD
jgi:hypothetical protein